MNKLFIPLFIIILFLPLNGCIKKADNRSDIYSIGMTFYEVLAGKLPFDPTESNLTIQLKILEGKITPLNQLNPNLPHQLVQIVNKAIHKDPDKRFQSAGAMLTMAFPTKMLPIMQVYHAQPCRVLLTDISI